MRNRCIKIGLAAFASTFFIMTGFAFIKVGNEVFQAEDMSIFLFISCLFAYSGYGTAKYFYIQKELYFSYNTKVKNVKGTEKVRLWGVHKKYMFSRLFFMIAKIVAIGTPGYVLAYLDDSKYLKSSIGIIIGLILLSICSYFLGKKYQKEYQSGIL